ncbi:MAG TPA: enolase C-terminal domain-like protein [Castellaniella sp.]|nr:enolase C-terminal domain-like protein [Castellaniella sp.]
MADAEPGVTAGAATAAEAVPIDALSVAVYTVPTDQPESDGTLEWTATTLVLVEIRGGGRSGLGYSYADTATATLIQDLLAPLLAGRDALAIPARWEDMRHAIRNLGRPGIASMAIAAVDVALWDLKAKCLGMPLLSLLGAARQAVPVYGSGGFTSYTDAQLETQLGAWAQAGIRDVKMKIGREPGRDTRRVRAARRAIGPDTGLFVDANGACSRKQALALAGPLSESGVSWFEEPVSSDDLEGLRLMRDHAPPAIEIAAGEYGYDLGYFRRMLDAGAVDVLQADATRCAGITGFMGAAALCEAHGLPLSAHCAPSIHAHPGCAAARVRHIEFFHDHVRIERLLFDGALAPVRGALHPDLTRPGLGLELKRADARRYAR